MSSTFGSFEIGRRAIHVMQNGAKVTGQNIANANTEGYTRQIQHMKAVIPAAVPGVVTPPGTGVEVSDIDRLRSEFYDNQLLSALTGMSYWERLGETLGTMEVIFLEPGELGINTALSDFFDAWQELSVNPESYAARVSLREQALTLIGVIGGVYDRLDEVKHDLEKELQATLDDVNALAREISELNKKIIFMQAIGTKSNEMLDERDKRLQELSELLNIRTIKKDNGGVEVLAGGRILVQDGRYFALEGRYFLDEEDLRDYYLIYNEMDSLLNITGGKLKALLQSYNDELFGCQRALDELVYGLVQQVNTLHRQGYGLEGSTGINFFAPWREVMPGDLVIDPFTLDLGGADNITGVKIDQKLAHIPLDGAYALDTLLVSAGADAAADVVATYSLNRGSLVQGVAVDDGVELNSSLLFEVTKVGDDHVFVRYYLYHTHKDGTAGYGEGIKKLYTGGVGNTLAYTAENGLELELELVLEAVGNFSAGDKFVVTVTAARAVDDQALTFGYQGGGNLYRQVLEPGGFDNRTNTLQFFQLDAESGAHREVRLQVTLGTLETETEAALFNVGPYQPSNLNAYIHRAAKNFRLSLEILQDVAHIAAAADNRGVGDGAGALAIARLREEKALQGGKATFHDFFRGRIAELGVAARESERMALAMYALAYNMREHQEGVSGVSLDDEMLNLIQFQHAYNAAAKYMSTFDQMLEMLIGTLGR